jgi:hypothetical protein
LSGSTLSISNGNSVVLPGSTGSQTLNTSSSGNQRTVSISNGNSITLNINDADSSSTNELQTIAKANGVISLSNNGGSVIDSDGQLLTISGSNLSITNGNTVTLPLSTNNSGYTSIINQNEIRRFTQLSTQSTTSISYINAIIYCANLVENGYNDWSLATMPEIQYFMESYSNSINNAIDTWVRINTAIKPELSQFGNPLQGIRFTYNNSEGEFSGISISSGFPTSSSPITKNKCHCFR